MRLIDADALIAEINDRIDAAIKWGVNAIADGDNEIKLRAEQAVATFCEASLTAKKMPTIDAVKVVRCEDCSHYGKDCVLLFPADGYCYDGERRGEEDDDRDTD